MFVQAGRLGASDRAFRDPILSAPRGRRRGFAGGFAGLGAAQSSTQLVSEGTTAVVSTAGTIAAATAAGATFGSVVPILGTAIGAVVGLAVGLLSKGGAPNPNALPIVQKWYAWYFPDWASMNAGSSVTLQSGYNWWVNQINADGVANAWANFSKSAQPVADNVAQRAALYQSLGYGGPMDPPPAGTSPLVAPPTNLTYQQFTGAAAPISTGPAVAPLPATATAASVPAQASILGGVSTTTLLLVGGGLLAGLVLLNRPREVAA